ncbi:MAG: bifunctional diguanylate cyclase/phosphodiesterase [Actinobacteria bacterium]|nr:bifunctional diguanylate cyclase/phosphodiesterase [Actinomycetota bacterium]
MIYGSGVPMNELLTFRLGGAAYYLSILGALGVGYAFVIGLLDRKVRESHENGMNLVDPVTGLPGRDLLADRLQQLILISEREASHVPLVVMGIDRFGAVNNALGRDQGDVLLAELATRLETTLRESDTVARLSGDEFAILMPSAQDGHGATTVVEKVRAELEKPFMIGDVPVEISASFGIALSPGHGRDAKTLIWHASAALGAAKESGTRVEFYSPDRHELNAEKIAMAAELRGAIEDRELVLFYQPKSSMNGGGIHAAEALVRWVHPHRGMIPPDEFIPLAEQTDLMKPLTMYVVAEAAKQVAEWRNRGLDMSVAVNISARNLSDVEFPNDIVAVLERHGADPKWIEFEVTESTVINDQSRAIVVLQTLCDMGIRIAIDDYGAGYTSLSYLTRLPIHALKIDKSFVQNMAEQRQDGLIVKSTIELGRGLGLDVVAEGVETEVVWNELADLGCDYAQGYYVSKPLPADELVLN